MEIQSVDGVDQSTLNSKSSGNVKLDAATSSLESSLELQKLVLKLLESSGINVDTKA